MLGTVPFPEGYGATVHLHWPGQDEFQLLGMLSNEKPSAIFKVKPPSAIIAEPAILGLSIQPLHSIQLPIVPKATNSNPEIIAQKIANHLFTYLSSFFPDPTALTPESVVPIAAIKKWYELFLGKLRVGGIGFLN